MSKLHTVSNVCAEFYIDTVSSVLFYAEDFCAQDVPNQPRTESWPVHRTMERLHMQQSHWLIVSLYNAPLQQSSTLDSPSNLHQFFQFWAQEYYHLNKFDKDTTLT